MVKTKIDKSIKIADSGKFVEINKKLKAYDVAPMDSTDTITGLMTEYFDALHEMKEDVCKAFIAKYGLGIDEVEGVYTPHEGSFTVRRKNPCKDCEDENKTRIAVQDTTWLYCRKCGKKL